MVTFICCSGGGQEGAGDLSDGWRAIVLRLSSPEESCQLPTFTLRSHLLPPGRVTIYSALNPHS